MTDVPNASATDRGPWRRLPGHQVLLGIGGFLALLVALVVMAIVLVVNLNHQETHLNTANTAYVNAVQSAALEAKAIANDQRGFLLSGDIEFVREAESRIAAVRAAFLSATAAAAGSAERDAVARAQHGFERWFSAFQGEVETFRSGDREGAIELSLGTDRDLRKGYEQALASAQVIGIESVQSGRDSVSAAATQTIWLLLAGLVVALIIGVVIGEWLFRTIARPLFRLVEVLYP